LLFCAKPPKNKKVLSIREVTMPEAVIVSAVRTPVGRAFKGSLRTTRPDDLAALAIKEALARVPAVEAKEIDDFPWKPPR
jgi:acetyl-CoA acetyltransferase